MRWGWGLRLARVLRLEFGLLLQWCWFGRLVVGRSAASFGRLVVGRHRKVGRSVVASLGRRVGGGGAHARLAFWLPGYSLGRGRGADVGDGRVGITVSGGFRIWILDQP